MNDELLPEWDVADPNRMAALDARLQEILLMHISGDPRWARTLVALADDLTSFDQTAEMLSSVCKFITNMAIWTYGRREAVGRFTADRAQLREIAREAQES